MLEPLALLKQRIGISTDLDDDLILQLRASAEAFIEEYTGRQLAGGEFTQEFPGAAHRLHLKNYPVASVESVTMDGEQIAPSRYYVHAADGVITSKYGTFGQDGLPWLVNVNAVVRVVYTVTMPVPETAKAVQGMLVAQMYEAVNAAKDTNHRPIRQQRLGDSFVTFSSLTVTQEVKRLLSPLRSVPI
jgi:hypothetical protein